MTAELAARAATPRTVSVIEVSPRDGLQNEAKVLDTDVKARLIASLAAAGARRIEVTSFVRPGSVPQLADADDLVRRLAVMPLGASLIALVLNARGARRALSLDRIDEVNLVVPCTDAFGLANQGMRRPEALALVPEVSALVREAGKSLSVTLAVAFGCPYEGAVEHDRFVEVLEALADSDIDELALADTLGCAVPRQVAQWCETASRIVRQPLRVHFHDSRRSGLANVWAAYGAGVDRFDASAGGFGGCPFAPGAAGNVATEDLLWMFQQSDVGTGLAAADFMQIGQDLARDLDSEPRSGVSRAGLFPPQSAVGPAAPGRVSSGAEP